MQPPSGYGSRSRKGEVKTAMNRQGQFEQYQLVTDYYEESSMYANGDGEHLSWWLAKKISPLENDAVYELGILPSGNVDVVRAGWQIGRSGNDFGYQSKAAGMSNN